MNGQDEKKGFRFLIAYYGILQSLHLFFLGRAGIILQQSGRVPFPASPPLGGWSSAVLPFFMGMAAVDSIAAVMGIYFAYLLLVNKRLKPVLGIISLTVALSSGVIYLFGTLPGGAWVLNPISYLIVIIVFSPIIPLYLVLIRETQLKLNNTKRS